MSTISPLEYAQRYWSLPVPIVDEKEEVSRWETVRVDHYRLAKKISKDPETYDADTTAFLKEFEGKVQPLDKKGKEIKVFVKKFDGTIDTSTFKFDQRFDLSRIAKRAIWGKGTPEDAQVTLQLALRFGVIKPPKTLQGYCNEGRIGLDCNGFVGSYMRDVLKKPVGPSTLITELLRLGTPITKIEHIDTVGIYVLGFVDDHNNVIAQYSGGKMGHIMITTPFGSNMSGGTYNGKSYKGVHVVESTGGKGLVYSNYLLISVTEKDPKKKNDKDAGVFTVFRGSKKELMKVRISRLQ